MTLRVKSLRSINSKSGSVNGPCHIRPVEHKGPETARNGVALAGTVHCMFDRGLISLSDDLDFLVSCQVNDLTASTA